MPSPSRRNSTASSVGSSKDPSLTSSPSKLARSGNAGLDSNKAATSIRPSARTFSSCTSTQTAAGGTHISASAVKPPSRRASQTSLTDRRSSNPSIHSRSSSISSGTGKIPSAYDVVHRDLFALLTPSTGTSTVARGPVVNLCHLDAYTGASPYNNQQLVFGKLTLLESYASRQTIIWDKPGRGIVTRKLLLTPETEIWPFLKPLRFDVDSYGQATNVKNCAGLSGVLFACSEEMLREGIMVFFECDVVLDEQALRKTPREFIHLHQPPVNVNILMTGYLRSGEDRSREVTSHPTPHRRQLYADRYARGPRNWGATLGSDDRATWPQIRDSSKGKETLVCFGALADPDLADTKTWNMRRIVARP